MIEVASWRGRRRSDAWCGPTPGRASHPLLASRTILGMTGQEALRRAIATLRANRIEDPEIEGEVLLRHVLGLDRTYLFLRLPEELTAEQADQYRDLIARRIAHIPTAYLTGRREFYSMSFAVGPGVLIPRPETEHLVEAALEVGRDLVSRHGRATLIDVGTGSGAAALAVVKHFPAPRVLRSAVHPAPLG